MIGIIAGPLFKRGVYDELRGVSVGLSLVKEVEPSLIGQRSGLILL